jgi:hypothetical protein
MSHNKYCPNLGYPLEYDGINFGYDEPLPKYIKYFDKAKKNADTKTDDSERIS